MVTEEQTQTHRQSVLTSAPWWSWVAWPCGTGTRSQRGWTPGEPRPPPRSSEWDGHYWTRTRGRPLWDGSVRHEGKHASHGISNQINYELPASGRGSDRSCCLFVWDERVYVRGSDFFRVRHAALILKKSTCDSNEKIFWLCTLCAWISTFTNIWKSKSSGLYFQKLFLWALELKIWGEDNPKQQHTHTHTHTHTHNAVSVHVIGFLGSWSHTRVSTRNRCTAIVDATCGICSTHLRGWANISSSFKKLWPFQLVHVLQRRCWRHRGARWPMSRSLQ